MRKMTPNEANCRHEANSICLNTFWTHWSEAPVFVSGQTGLTEKGVTDRFTELRKSFCLKMIIHEAFGN